MVGNRAPIDDSRNSYANGIKIMRVEPPYIHRCDEVLNVAQVMRRLGYTAMLYDLALVVDAPTNPARARPVDGGYHHHALVVFELAHQLEILAIRIGVHRVVRKQVHD